MFDYGLPFDDGTYTIIIEDCTPDDAASVIADLVHDLDYEPAWIYNPDYMYNL